MQHSKARSSSLVGLTFAALVLPHMTACVCSRSARSPLTTEPLTSIPSRRTAPKTVATNPPRAVRVANAPSLEQEPARPQFPDASDSPGTPPAGPLSHPSLISLYGDELVGSTHNVAMPFDGSSNTHQVSFSTEGSTFDPHVDRDGDRIVFASTRHHSTSDIYLKSTAGTAVTQLTSDPGDDIMPSLDPGGRHVAFASNRAGNWDIYYKPVTGGRPVQITKDADAELHPTWSPDGKYLAYCKFGSRSGRWEIWAVEIANPSTPRILTYGVFPEWSPDVLTNKILFQRARQRGSHYHSVWTVDFVNGEALNPTEILSAGNAALINPSWAPDASRVVFVTVVDPEQQPHPPSLSDVWSVNLDGTNPMNLTNGKFANYQPVWAGNGTIYFISNRSGIDNIWAISTVGADVGPQSGSFANVDPDQSPGGQP